MHSNRALILEKHCHALRVVPRPTAQPSARQIAVRVRAVAVNPVDRYLPYLNGLITPWLTFPAVLGSDVAGTVVAVGSEVERFRPGDRVLGLALGTEKGRGAAEGAFQEYAILEEQLASLIPHDMAYETAAVLPLGISTAAAGLFQSDFLALRYPTAQRDPDRRSVLIWGGSTSVGSNAIQLAVQAGYDVVTTAAPHNHAYVTRLGARAAYDYRSPTIVSDLIASLHGRELAGAMAIGDRALGACIAVLRRSEGRRFVAIATPSMSVEALVGGDTSWRRLIPFFARMGLAVAKDAVAARVARVTTKFIWGSSIRDNEIGPMVFDSFLPSALADGRYRANPPPLVVGDSLEAIPTAFVRQAAGVSAQKVVVTLGTPA